jgi:hypothetical protein
MERKTLNCGGTLVSSVNKATLIATMQDYYNCGMSGDHVVGYFDYKPDDLIKYFPLCQHETLESIAEYFHNYRPKSEYKYAICSDKESRVFPKYSIVDWSVKSKYKLWKRALKIFIEEDAHRFIIFTNYKEKKALFGSGSYGHIIFCAENDEGLPDEGKNDFDDK